MEPVGLGDFSQDAADRGRWRLHEDVAHVFALAADGECARDQGLINDELADPWAAAL